MFFLEEKCLEKNIKTWVYGKEIRKQQLITDLVKFLRFSCIRFVSVIIRHFSISRFLISFLPSLYFRVRVNLSGNKKIAFLSFHSLSLIFSFNFFPLLFFFHRRIKKKILQYDNLSFHYEPPENLVMTKCLIMKKKNDKRV